jgi:hypothetical protein
MAVNRDFEFKGVKESIQVNKLGPLFGGGACKAQTITINMFKKRKIEIGICT